MLGSDKQPSYITLDQIAAEYLTNGLDDFEDHLPRMNTFNTARPVNTVCLFYVNTALITSRYKMIRSIIMLLLSNALTLKLTGKTEYNNMAILGKF